MSEIQMRVSGISKSFPGVKALSNIDFAVRKGTVHALCGENGAGKSTLMKIINGLYKADEGQVFIDEKPVEIKNPIQARELGISMIAQELNYASELSVEVNIFMGRLTDHLKEPRKQGPSQLLSWLLYVDPKDVP